MMRFKTNVAQSTFMTNFDAKYYKPSSLIFSLSFKSSKHYVKYMIKYRRNAKTLTFQILKI